MIILLTNDDGIHSRGLLALRDVLAKDYDVTTIAPERERTCIAHAITLHKPLRIRKVETGTYASNGTPADCVLLGAEILLKRKPDFVISGINTGPNMGQDINYSGTVAAGKEGARLGVQSLSVSLNARKGFFFGDAASVVAKILERLIERPLPVHAFLNINIPNTNMANMRGFMVTKLGKRIYNDTVIERKDPRGGKYYWIASKADSYEPLSGTDFDALDKGYVSVTPLNTDGMNIQHHIIKKIFKGGLEL